jgi:hypothetical protein
MRVNIYAEEMTDRIEIVEKEINEKVYTGLRIYLYLPVTTRDGVEHRGPFIHRQVSGDLPHDDDSSAVTFWGKADLRDTLSKALHVLDEYYTRRQKIQ